MDFGTVKDIFTEKLIESYISKDKKGKNLYKKFIKTIKENEVLKTAFIVYKNIEDKTIKSEVRANEYLKENISLLEKYRGDDSIKKQTNILLGILKENNVDLSTRKIKEVHKNLETILHSEKNALTINKIEESKSNLLEWLMTDKKINTEEESSYIKENVDLKKFLKIATEKFNEKYSELTEEEKDILKVLRENDKEKTKTLVSQLIKETISLVNQHLEQNVDNVTIKSKLLETKDAIYKMVENSDDSNQNVLRLYELKKNLKND
jgi:hypothetical protein